MHITNLEVSNVMKLKVINWKPGRHMNIIGGRNEQGKTSLLRAIEWAFSGGGKKMGLMPIRQGEDDLKIHIELEGLPGKGLVVERLKNAETGKDDLFVTGEEGQSYSSPQGILNNIKNMLLDPLAFSRMDAKKQRTVLMELLGLDFAELDAKYKGAEDRRRDFNREAKRLKANLKPLQEDAELVDVAELSKELSAAHESNRIRSDALTALSDMQVRQDQIMRGIEEARKELDTIEESRVATRKRVDENDEVHTDIIQSQIDAAGEINARHEHNRLMTATKAAMENEYEEAGTCTEIMIAAEAEKKSMLTNAKPPIEGLAVTDDGVTFDSGDGVGPVPLENCSGAQTLRISFAIMAGLKPDLQVALIQDGSLLDDEHLLQIEEMCKEFNIQALVERVGTGDECALIIEDGEAVPV